ncbi:MAG: hypothetical protein HC944_02820 [Nanoarchaeota archaeon]|nr:hypothetical protein [Nanoarchaeota archaeon]
MPPSKILLEFEARDKNVQAVAQRIEKSLRGISDENQRASDRSRARGGLTAEFEKAQSALKGVSTELKVLNALQKSGSLTGPQQKISL